MHGLLQCVSISVSSITSAWYVFVLCVDGCVCVCRCACVWGGVRDFKSLGVQLGESAICAVY